MIKSSPESLRLIVAGRRGDDLVSVFVDSPSGGGSELALFLALLLDLGDLLPLSRWRGNLHTQDNVTDLGLCE